MTDETEIDRQKLVLGLAQLIWDSELTLGEYFDAVQMHPDPDLLTELSGIFTGWNNPKS